MRLAELGEFGLIDRIKKNVAASPSVLLGIGDDAAALVPAPECVTLITCDMLLESVHFDLSFCDPESLGRKSLSVNLSDLAAMGAHPRQFLLGIALGKEVPIEFMDRFMAGVLEQAERFGATLVGGDTCASKGGIAISITALGEQRPELVLKRSGARPGDLICLSGTVGDAAAGLVALRQGVREGFLVSRQLDPTPRVAAGVALAEGGLATAMIDVSDGVLGDLGHIREMSGVGARLELAKLPLSDEYRAACGDDPYALALSGGEDYELLFCIAPGKRGEVEALFAKLALRLSVIGEITATPEVKLVTPGGGVYAPGHGGFDHFG
ncbi:thiamin monophosphate kinase [Citrifermentans bemidjiense Bem]|uniref:Thiamine-monophosphate kinase n=1 Tax=Citrifermentans bemidjiense (strain ATCC BAA-1014 / DSM 16622 / JCM 12645 / Bem) TaxID=404380 RepID=B5ED47_CITBB|nr:thiamine-phosphate kinase [Citrifermentans bemidjiense]ACH37633.1 thiamin monophosphate kinase [Citrifermentans bemidjiense Bem]